MNTNYIWPGPAGLIANSEEASDAAQFERKTRPGHRW